MARNENFGRQKENEEERKRRWSRFSPTLSHTILTNERQQPLTQEIPEQILAAFQTGSIAERDAYWEGKGKYGQKMLNWVGLGPQGKPGMRQWVEKQTDPDVIRMLQAVGLQNSPKQREEGLNDANVIALMHAIANDFPPESHAELGNYFQEETVADSLIFYSRYLNQKKGSSTDSYRSLINTLFEEAGRESNGDIDETIKKLEKVSPLLAAAGEEGQDVLAALLVAKTHAGKPETLASVTPESQLNDAEQRVMGYVKKYAKPQTESAQQETSEVSEQKTVFRVEKEFEELTPEPTSGHAYFVDRPIPADFATKLTPERLKQLELRKTFWDTEGNLNREVFDPAYTLEHDERFVNAEALTNNDSGLFALAAASAATPERQTALYKTLGETILRVHKANPQLLEDFLNVQASESEYKFAENDYNRAEPLLQKNSNNILQTIESQFREKFQEYGPQVQAFNDDTLIHVADYPDRLLSLHAFPSADPDRLGLDFQIDVPATAKVWPERIQALQEVLAKEPLVLSRDQIRQIEFLAHSVDTAQIIKWLQGESTLSSTPVAPLGPTGPGLQAEEAAPMKQGMEYDLAPASLTLAEFFQNMQGKLSLERRNDFDLRGNQDATQMKEFSTEKENIGNFKVMNARGELAIYTDLKDTTGILLPSGTNLFLSTLMQEGSLSQEALTMLARQGYGQNTLLAYAMEAVSGPAQQEALVKNVFSEVIKIYSQHPELREQVMTYFMSLPQNESFWKTTEVERLVGNEEEMKQRLGELQAKLQENQKLEVKDYSDMGFYALPFNLQHITQRMQNAFAYGL